MFDDDRDELGRPLDVDGKCNAWLHIADNHGDNCATMRCQLEPGHVGLHQERYDASYEDDEHNWVVVTWEQDMKEEDDVEGGERHGRLSQTRSQRRLRDESNDLEP